MLLLLVFEFESLELSQASFLIDFMFVVESLSGSFWGFLGESKGVFSEELLLVMVQMSLVGFWWYFGNFGLGLFLEGVIKGPGDG